uniref:tyrosine-protein kinase family protein n=1 Tax=Acidimangrovimonas sediminis TaxID=2056283 RepID=UPI0038BCA2CB
HDDLIGCDILLSGESNVNGTDVFASQAFARVMDRTREIYDIVVIDTPPVLVVPDARVIAQLADAVLFVVRWDSTLKAQVSEGLKMLELGNARVAGLALNQISAKGMKSYGYGAEYGAYAAYGQRYYTE